MEDLSELNEAFQEIQSNTTTGPLWKGPQSNEEMGGITFSLLSRFLVCRERFRLLVVEGLSAHPQFNHRLEFGNLWHLAEETYGKCQSDPTTSGKWKEAVNHALKSYADALCRTYPTDRGQVEHWYNVCKLQFPIYLDYWRKNKDEVVRKPLLSEAKFCVPYRLPSSRVVYLRGKWDSVDLISTDRGSGIYLQENKTKGDIDPIAIRRQLAFDLQTMLYIVALQEWQKQDGYGEPIRFSQATSTPIRGVRYNVVRRPLSGGKGSIVRHKPTKLRPLGESLESFYGRLAEIIKGGPGHYFMRWKLEIMEEDIEKFKVQCFNPILEQLCDWWDWIGTLQQEPFDVEGSGGIHWRHPFGVYNPLDEGGSTDVDNYLATGSEVGLSRCKTLFPELQ